MPEEGIEPSRPCGHGILSPARLPVSPLRPSSHAAPPTSAGKPARVRISGYCIAPKPGSSGALSKCGRRILDRHEIEPNRKGRSQNRRGGLTDGDGEPHNRTEAPLNDRSLQLWRRGSVNRESASGSKGRSLTKGGGVAVISMVQPRQRQEWQRYGRFVDHIARGRSHHRTRERCTVSDWHLGQRTRASIDSCAKPVCGQ